MLAKLLIRRQEQLREMRKHALDQTADSEYNSESGEYESESNESVEKRGRYRTGDTKNRVRLLHQADQHGDSSDVKLRNMIEKIKVANHLNS